MCPAFSVFRMKARAARPTPLSERHRKGGRFDFPTIIYAQQCKPRLPYTRIHIPSELLRLRINTFSSIRAHSRRMSLTRSILCCALLLPALGRAAEIVPPDPWEVIHVAREVGPAEVTGCVANVVEIPFRHLRAGLV